MKLTSTEVQNRFGFAVDAAQREPVEVINGKTGDAKAFLISTSKYYELQALEDKLWAMRAEQALREGFATDEEIKDTFHVAAKSKWCFVRERRLAAEYSTPWLTHYTARSNPSLGPGFQKPAEHRFRPHSPWVFAKIAACR